MSQERYVGILVGLITAIVTLILLALLEQRDAIGEGVPPRQHSAYDRKLIRLDRAGVDAAYRSRVALLFQNWMTDTTAASQDRALRGHRNAQKIYIEVMAGIDARDPPTEDDLK